MSIKQRLKLNVLVRYGSVCYLCGDKLSLKSVTLDHVVPRSVKKGVPHNLRPACLRCNQLKGAMPIDELIARIRKIFFRQMEDLMKAA